MEHEMYHIDAFSDWDICAASIAPELRSGDILALSGPLGAGKTTFTQALARALGSEGDPRSPTFSLMRTYRLSNHPSLKRLIHIDAYRLEKPEDMLALNLEEEMAELGTLLVIEWPENIQTWLNRQRDYCLMTIKLQEWEKRDVFLERKSL